MSSDLSVIHSSPLILRSYSYRGLHHNSLSLSDYILIWVLNVINLNDSSHIFDINDRAQCELHRALIDESHGVNKS